MEQVSHTNFLFEGIDTINANFGELVALALTGGLTDIGSGVTAPVRLTMGADNLHWLLPSNLVGRPIILDHGFVLPQAEYTIIGNEVVLDTAPSMPYEICVAVSRSGAGITRPVSLQPHPSFGPQFWLLPEGYGHNILVYDHGRMLRRDEYRVIGNLVEFADVPLTPYDISASWGHGGPGLFPPVALVRQFPLGLDYQHWLLPSGTGPTPLVLDSGLVLSADDYSINHITGVVTLNYVASPPYNITTTNGWPMLGQYVHEAIITPAPDGTNQDFILPEEVLGGTILLRQRDTSGMDVIFNRGEHFDIEGRALTFLGANIPDSGTTLLASFSTPNAFNPLLLGNSGIGENNQTVVPLEGILMPVNTLSEEVTYVGATDQINVHSWKDGATVVRTRTHTYDGGTGLLTQVVDVAGGVTITESYTYDGSRRLTGVARVRS